MTYRRGCLRRTLLIEGVAAIVASDAVVVVDEALGGKVGEDDSSCVVCFTFVER
jgi:hypothetical protein